MNIHTNISELVGNTPLLEPVNYIAKHGLQAHILLKLEYLNPAGSVKDRVANSIIAKAESEGKLHPGSTIIEPTSGNTGIGIAAIAASKGYKAILTMPDTMSVERRNILQAYGAEIVLTPGDLGMKGAIDKAYELQKSIPGSIIAAQFENPENPAAHYNGTGPEIWADTEGTVDILVAGVGTGGTISGTGKYLKEKNPAIHIVAVEPASSAILSGGCPGAHKIQGIGAGFIPGTLDTSICDEIICVDNETPFTYARELGKTDGVLTGISGGAALYAATLLARRPENAGKRIVAILPDNADRYFSTPIFGQ
ncbi:MAG: cysteine synthase A [Akkermansia sp.]|nr:cysteine synthase A [Akkermansia sp.]